MLKIRILTSLRPNGPAWQELLANQKRRYAAAHGYEFVQQEAHWDLPVVGKFDLIQQHLATAHWVAWMDADVYIAQQQVKLEEYFTPQTSVVLANRIYCIDPGVMLFASDHRTHLYLTRVRQLYKQWRPSCPKPCHAKCGWFLACNKAYVKQFTRTTGDLLSTHPDNPHPRFAVHPYDRSDKAEVIEALIANRTIPQASY